MVSFARVGPTLIGDYFYRKIAPAEVDGSKWSTSGFPWKVLAA